MLEHLSGFVLASLIMSIPELLLIVFGNNIFNYKTPLYIITTSALFGVVFSMLIYYIKGKKEVSLKHIEGYLDLIVFALFLPFLAVVDGIITELDGLLLVLAYFLILLATLYESRGKKIDFSTFYNEISPILLGMVTMSLVINIVLYYVIRTNLSPNLVGLLLGLVSVVPQLVSALVSDKHTLEESVGSTITLLTLALGIIPLLYGEIKLKPTELSLIYLSIITSYMLLVAGKLGKIDKEEIIIMLIALFTYLVHAV